MFQRRPEAAKAALLGLIELLHAAGTSSSRLLDAQWYTPHLGLLGAQTISRAEYAKRLEAALTLPAPPGFGDGQQRRSASGEAREIVREADEEEK
jgi:leucyl/phenylalanyl-tRNA---protein transferase